MEKMDTSISHQDDENTIEKESSSDEKEKQELEKYIKEAKTRIELKHESRIKNQNIKYQDNVKNSKLDSSLKKNTAFVRKLRNFTEQQLDGFLKEMSTLNIEKYISEVATAIVEAKLKISDINAAILLCTKIHELYSEFSKALFEQWQKTLSFKKDGKIANSSKYRVDLRFYGDLIIYGILPQKEGLSFLGNILNMLIATDKEEHNNASIILTFCKHCGEEIAGLVPMKIRQLSEKYNKTSEIPKSNILPPEKQKAARTLFVEYFNSMSNRLIREHKQLELMDKQNRKILQTRGELNTDKKERTEMLHLNYQKLYSTVQNFSEVLDEIMPEIRDTKDEKEMEDDHLDNLEEGEEGFVVDNIWEDDETREFYEDLLNVYDYIGGGKKQTTNEEVEKEEKEGEKEEKQNGKEMDSEKGNEKSKEIDEETSKDKDVEKSRDKDNEKMRVKGNEKSKEKDTEKSKEKDNEKCKDKDNEKIREKDNEKSKDKDNEKSDLDIFLSHLCNCSNKEMIDKAAIEYLSKYYNKGHRKKLVKLLFSVPRTRLDLIPLYSRFTALLSPAIPDLAEELCNALKMDFRYQVRKKDQINIESKIKVIRFIGELVKFRLYSKPEGLYCLKILLNDFTHHHIEMTSNFLETCGRYLYLSRDTHQRCKIYLEQMMRKKAALNLDWRYSTMIENAYFSVNPPEFTAPQIKQRTPLQEFIRKLLYHDLCNNEQIETRVLNSLRKIDWEDEGISNYVIKCLTNAWNVKYFNIKCLANLLAGLVEYQPQIGTQVVDNVLEDIRITLEINSLRMNQRRVAMIKYLGELYNYRMVESRDIFKMLYTLISFGVSPSHDIVSPLDTPDSTFRIRLVCILLETCGQYFNYGLSKTRLDCFFVYFQHYYWFKRSHKMWTEFTPFPIYVQYMVNDLIVQLRPNLKLHTNYDDAKADMMELQQKLISKLDIPRTTDTGDLSTILENDGENSEEDEEEEEEEEEERVVNNEDNNALDVKYIEREDVKNETEEEDDDDDYEESDEDEDNNNNVDPDDEAFIDAFEKMLTENIQERAKEIVKPQLSDISVPYNLKNTMKRNDQDESSVNFVLLLRKGNKQQYKNLEVPITSELAVNLKSQEKARNDEKEQVKRLTLDINDRLEEEDYQDQSQSTTIHPKIRYNHQKGVPDVDAIFGKKKGIHK